MYTPLFRILQILCAHMHRRVVMYHIARTQRSKSIMKRETRQWDQDTNDHLPTAATAAGEQQEQDGDGWRFRSRCQMQTRARRAWHDVNKDDKTPPRHFKMFPRSPSTGCRMWHVSLAAHLPCCPALGLDKHPHTHAPWRLPWTS